MDREQVYNVLFEWIEPDRPESGHWRDARVDTSGQIFKWTEGIPQWKEDRPECTVDQMR